MKKFFGAFIAALMMITFTACGNSAAEKNSTPEAKPADKILVAYFSCTGKTKAAALEVAEILKADTFEIVPAQAYTSDDLNYHAQDCRANIEQKNSAARPEIKNKIENIEQYKAIVVAFPIWWGAEPRIIDTFVESYNLDGKIIVPVCTSGGSDIQTSAANLKQLCKGANVLDGKRLGILSKDELKAWVASLKL